MYFIDADHHFGHHRIIEYCNRPFKNVSEMDSEIIRRHNEVVGSDDIVIHAGDFSLVKDARFVHEKYVSKLNGKNMFLKGSHDYWLQNRVGKIHEITIDGIFVVICHYAMRVWARSHYNSWHCYGHSHGNLESIGKSMDVGVDTHNFYPYSFEEIKNIMKSKPDNFNKIKER